MINRPTTAWTIELTDEELAKVGLLALLDSQCQMAIASALKAVARLDFEAWRRLASTPLEQLLTRLVDAARPIDIELMHLAEEAQAKKDVLVRRHQAVHGIWANDKSVDGIRAWDIKRGLHLATSDLDAAISTPSTRGVASSVLLSSSRGCVAWWHRVDEGTALQPRRHVRPALIKPFFRADDTICRSIKRAVTSAGVPPTCVLSLPNAVLTVTMPDATRKNPHKSSHRSQWRMVLKVPVQTFECPLHAPMEKLLEILRPCSQDSEEAESVYQSILALHSAPRQQRRLSAIHFVHNRKPDAEIEPCTI